MGWHGEATVEGKATAHVGDGLEGGAFWEKFSFSQTV